MKNKNAQESGFIGLITVSHYWIKTREGLWPIKPVSIYNIGEDIIKGHYRCVRIKNTL